MIDERQAIELARAAANSEGWAFAEPIACELRKSWTGKPMYWTIRSNAINRGSNARFVIDANNGDIKEKGYVPR